MDNIQIKEIINKDVSAAKVQAGKLKDDVVAKAPGVWAKFKTWLTKIFS